MAVMSSTNSFPQVAFIGLGAMGFAMSTHLVRAGFPVTGYDIYEPTLKRWQSTCKEIPNSRASIADAPSDTVKNASVVCLMVATHHHVHSALFDEQIGAVGALPKDCTVIIHATIPPTEPLAIRARLTDEFKRADVKLIDAPVSGGVARSINGTLTIMAASNSQKVLEQPEARIVLDNLTSKGKTLFVIPGTLGAGQSAKALNQIQAGVHIPAASEIMGLAAVNGVDTQKFYDTTVSKDSSGRPPLGWSWMLENRGPRMLSADPPLASATQIINKDVGIIRGEEERLKVELPLLNKASEIIKGVMETHAGADDSCIVQSYLGFDSERSNLVVRRAGNATIAASEQESLIRDVTIAHAIIHLISAHETIRFAKAMDLMRPDQTKQWFSLIAGAAGGSTVFIEVIPRALEDPDGVDSAFKKYANEKFGRVLDKTLSLISNSKSRGYQPILLESAVGYLRRLLES